MLTKTDIEKLLRFGERVNLECKDASGGLPKSVWGTYSAFANTDEGGFAALKWDNAYLLSAFYQ